MPRHRQGDDAPFLFDLPLEGPARELEPHTEPSEPSEPRRGRPAAGEERASTSPTSPSSSTSHLVAVPSELPVEELRVAPLPGRMARSALRSRLAAGLADLIVHGALAVLAVAGARLLGAKTAVSDWPAIAAFLLSFSFLYTVLPLAFWGQTLGMSWAGLTARNRDGEPLSFDQAARRWLGALLTAGTAGLPLFVAADRRSLTDLISGSVTYQSA
jgi:uncharacterized RDD family membrane protein YckC